MTNYATWEKERKTGDVDVGGEGGEGGEELTRLVGGASVSRLMWFDS